MPSNLISEILPEGDLRKSLVERYQDDAGKALAAYGELEREFSQTVRVPGEKAPPETIAKFRKHLGIPEKPEDYAAPETKDEFLAAALTELRPVALELGVPKKAWDGLAAKLAERGTARVTESSAAEEAAKAARTAAAQEALVAKFGDEKKADAAVASVREFLGKKLPGFKQELERAGLDTNPEIVEALVKVRDLVSNDRITGGLEGPGREVKDDPMKLASRGREIVLSGIMEDVRNHKRGEAFAEFLDIVQKLERLGFQGPEDARLMPKDPFGNVLTHGPLTKAE